MRQQDEKDWKTAERKPDVEEVQSCAQNETKEWNMNSQDTADVDVLADIDETKDWNMNSQDMADVDVLADIDEKKEWNMNSQDTAVADVLADIDEENEWNMDRLWRVMEERQGTLFYTAKNLPFRYAIRGGEMFVDRRTRSVTKATFARALQKVSAHPGEIHGPKALNVFGAPYVWAIFVTLGVVDTGKR